MTRHILQCTEEFFLGRKNLTTFFPFLPQEHFVVEVLAINLGKVFKKAIFHRNRNLLPYILFSEGTKIIFYGVSFNINDCNEGRKQLPTDLLRRP
jgi:hypothetical protein